MLIYDSHRLGDARQNLMVAMGLFLAGRVFFLRGSQTPRCGLLVFAGGSEAAPAVKEKDL